MKIYNALLACALGAGSLLAAAPASAAHISGGTVRTVTTGRVVPGNRSYVTRYRTYNYRTVYRYPRPAYGYGYGYPYGYGVSVGVGIGYGYAGGSYGYGGAAYGVAPYPAVYGTGVYYARRPYWHPRRHVYRAPRFAR